MFVCTGNICRSPLGHALLQNLVDQRGLSDHFFIESSGLSAYHVGEEADSRMRATAARHGAGFSHYSRKFYPEDLKTYDLVLAMDQTHFADLENLSRQFQGTAEIRMFRDDDPEGPGDVPDPWYGGAKGFETVYEMVNRTCGSLLEEVLGRIS